MSWYDVLGIEPEGQVTRCEVRDLVTTSSREAARAFDLFETVNDEVDEDAARLILESVLCEYADWLGPLAVRQALAREATARFLQPFAGLRARYFTNGSFNEGRLSGWNPATLSALDTGILILGETQVACLWVQNDD
jgi:hypothetical protein